jgi:SpoVK/Ycf46/Vps4 family AAA+-type ATPase
MSQTSAQGQEPVEKSARYANSMEEILALIKGRAPLIWVLTHEESRFIEEFSEKIAEPCKRQVWLWSAYQGLVRSEQQTSISRASGEEKDTHNPQKALARVAAMNKPSETKGLVYIMRDFHTVLGEPVPRQIRDMYDHLIHNGKTLIITSPILAHGPGGTKAGLPPTLEKQLSVVHYELPDGEIIKGRVREVIAHMKESVKGKNKKTALEYPEETIHGFSRALQGLTMSEVDTALSTSITHLNRIDQDKLINDKRQIIRKSEILEFIDTPVGVKDVGGLDLAKMYLAKYAKAHSDDAKEFGVEPLKGLLLTGVPGTGKSLLAKATGKLWGVPLLRLDVGKVMTGLVGGSEGKMREVINQAEAMSPCILWIDEVEKSLSGTKSSNFSDGGTLSRVFGTLLTAMQDGMHGVTVVATANDITMLPPEFIRRFNEVFFVDLPGPEERWEIFDIHLKKRGRNIDKLKSHKKAILDASNDYTGAEIEKAIKDAIAAAFYSGKKDVGFEDFRNALQETKPIAETMAEKITKIRKKARDHYRFASTFAEVESKQLGAKTKSGKRLDMNDALEGMDELKTKKQQAQEEKNNASNRFADAVSEE